MIHWASTGVPQDIELLNNLKAVFTVSADPSGAALLLLLPARPLLQSCLLLLPSLLPAEVPPHPAAFWMHPAQRTVSLRPCCSLYPPPSSQIRPLLPAAVSMLLVSFVPPNSAHPTGPVQTPVLAPGSGHLAWDCPLWPPLPGAMLLGMLWCLCPHLLSSPRPQPGSVVPGRGQEEAQAVPADPAFFPLHQQSSADPQDGPRGAIDMQMSRENQC